MNTLSANSDTAKKASKQEDPIVAQALIKMLAAEDLISVLKTHFPGTVDIHGAEALMLAFIAITPPERRAFYQALLGK